MPGVPSGRACDACRKQKKKCDEKQPACARCIRLKLKCVGSGMKRFKFQAEKDYTVLVSNKSSRSSPNHDFVVMQPESFFTPLGQMDVYPSPCSSPGNELSLLRSAFTKTINRSTDLRYNLWWAFGGFLEDIPRRLGTNEALDHAIDTLTTAHGSFCIGRKASVETLTKYSHALRTLRIYLDDRVHAHSSSTLCAVMVLLVCQTFMGQSTQSWSGHSEGAAQILKARKSFGPRDEFEKKLFLSLRGSVLFEGLFNDKIDLTPEEWHDLVRSEFDETTPDGRILRCLSHGPDLMRRIKHTHKTGGDKTNLHEEVWSTYQTCKMNLSEIKLRASENDIAALNTTQMSRTEKLIAKLMYAHYQRTYGIGLTITLFFNGLLRVLGVRDGIATFDANYLAEEALALAERSVIYRPVGAAYLIFCLTFAWVATSEPRLRRSIMDALYDYNDDFKIRDSGKLEKDLESSFDHFHLGFNLQDG
ncbi:transcriptional regulator family: Fungal Specific TF [Penicillium taxi]|uniref:transcriptional regulator family: Fungal Specific TF n=1 Tax=Penicillium taxi TaxID=168475 RepID=UPI002545B27B|nr:transcriptional regulator family: Fungal Specific TF [Penicillium taxi]KAJ5899551.1 transcriptional regulator family: Fungal Specific TF [Penicillium taxi]